MAGRRGGRARGLTRWLRLLGPGLITGASDDDPSGITTDSIAGACFGYDLLRTAAASTPLMTGGPTRLCGELGSDRPGRDRSGAGLLPAVGAPGRPPAPPRGERFQHCRRSGRHGEGHRTPQRAPPRLADSDALTTTGRPLIPELSRIRGRGHQADPGTRRAGEHVLEDAPAVTPRTPSAAPTVHGQDVEYRDLCDPLGVRPLDLQRAEPSMPNSAHSSLSRMAPVGGETPLRRSRRIDGDTASAFPRHLPPPGGPSRGRSGA